jgi:hypothetical protein
MKDVFIIYIGKRDRKGLFTFTLHFQLGAVSCRWLTADRQPIADTSADLTLLSLISLFFCAVPTLDSVALIVL